ncbi:MAG: hypothetical protein ACXQTL_02295 [Methanosarcinales archaeon]
MSLEKERLENLKEWIESADKVVIVTWRQEKARGGESISVYTIDESLPVCEMIGILKMALDSLSFSFASGSDISLFESESFSYG